MDRFWGPHFGQFIFEIEKTSDEMDRADATGWLVVCIDNEAVHRGEEDCVVGCYGPFATPEEALVEAGRHDSTSLPLEDDDLGWTHLIKPLYSPVNWRSDGR